MSQEKENYDYIKFKNIFSFFWRNKKIISPITISFLILSIIYAFIAKKTWEGQFQIVLATDERSELSDLVQSNQQILQLAGGDSDNKLDTEVTILESPLVLMPIFEFIKESKKVGGQNIDNLSFQDWKKDNLSIALKRGTSVLNISYFDQDKNLVLPVIEMMSKAYQNYSQRNRKISLDQGINYLETQTKIFKEKSLNSLRKAQSYAIEQNLTSLKNENDEDILNNFGVEFIRIKAADQIRLIDEQLKLFTDPGFDKKYMGRFKWTVVPEMKENPLFIELNRIDFLLETYKSKYKANDIAIKSLQDEKANLLETLSNQTIIFLNAEREKMLAIMKSAERPKGTLVKYRELVRESLLDRQTLENLEQQKQALLLERAKEQKPWELITKPTILDKPVAPQKKQIALLGLISGLFISSSLAYIKEKRTNYIYDKDLIEYLLPFEYLFTLYKKNVKKWDEYIALLAKSLYEQGEISSIELISLGELPKEINDKLLKSFKNKLPKIKIISTNDLNNTNEISSKILVMGTGLNSKFEIDNFLEKIKLMKTLISGFIIID